MVNAIILLLLLFTVSSIAVTLDDNSLTAALSAFLFKLVLVVSKLFSKAVIEFVVELTLPSRTSTLLARSDKAEEEAKEMERRQEEILQSLSITR